MNALSTSLSNNHKHCCVPECLNSAYKDKNLSFHVFPRPVAKWSEDRKIRALKRKNQWIAILELDKEVTDTMFVCSEHFTESDFFQSTPGSGLKRRRLKENAIPSKKLPTFEAVKSKKKTKHHLPMRVPVTRPKVSKKEITAISPTKTSSICSDHFLSEDFLLSAPGTPTRLKPNAEPSIHKLTNNDVSVDKKVIKVDSDTTSSSVEELEINLTDNNSDSDNSTCNTSDSESLSSEEIVKQKLEIMTALYKKTRKKLKLCQEQCNLYVKQVIALEEVIDNLRQINSVSDIS